MPLLATKQYTQLFSQHIIQKPDANKLSLSYFVLDVAREA